MQTGNNQTSLDPEGQHWTVLYQLIPSIYSSLKDVRNTRDKALMPGTPSTVGSIDSAIPPPTDHQLTYTPHAIMGLVVCMFVCLDSHRRDHIKLFPSPYQPTKQNVQIVPSLMLAT